MKYQGRILVLGTTGGTNWRSRIHEFELRHRRTLKIVAFEKNKNNRKEAQRGPKLKISKKLFPTGKGASALWCVPSSSDPVTNDAFRSLEGSTYCNDCNHALTSFDTFFPCSAVTKTFVRQTFKISSQLSIDFLLF